MTGQISRAFRDENLPHVTWYPVNESPMDSSLFSIDLPETVSKMTRVIYAFRDLGAQPNDKYLVGETATSVKERLNSHVSSFNTSKDYGDTAIGKVVRERCQDIFFAVIEQVSVKDSVEEREIYWINRFNSFAAGYNKNKGGGGGTSKVDSKVLAVASKAFKFTTPPKYRTAIPKVNGLKVLWSPDAPTTNGGYVIKVEELIDGKIVTKRYAGRSIKVKERVQNHFWHAFSSGDGADRPLSVAIRNNPERVSVGIYAAHQPDMDEAEREYTELKRREGLVYNQKSGGGSFARALPVSPPPKPVASRRKGPVCDLTATFKRL